MVVWVDMRTKAGRHRKEMAVAHATRLRARGWTFAEIAPIVGMNPASLAMYVPHCLTRLSPRELEDARRATSEGRSREEVTVERLLAQKRRWDLYRTRKHRQSIVRQGLRMALRELHVEDLRHTRQWAKLERQELRERQDVEREVEREARRDERDRIRWLRAHREAERRWAGLRAREHLRRERLTEKALERLRAREERELLRARRRMGRVFKPSRSQMVSLDAPLSWEADVTLHQFIAAPSISEPQTVMEQREIQELVGGLTIEDIDRLDDRTLGYLQEKLRAAGYGHRSVTKAERDAVRPCIPKAARAPRRLGQDEFPAEPEVYIAAGVGQRDRKRRQRLRKARSGRRVHGLVQESGPGLR